MDFIKEFWAVIVAVVGAIGWLVRLESRGLSNEKEIRRLWEQRKEDNAEAKSSRHEVLQAIRDLQQDVKKLLERPR